MIRFISFLTVLVVSLQQLMAQPDTTISVNSESMSNGKLWSIGFIIAFLIGIALYFIIKKNPRKDAVR